MAIKFLIPEIIMIFFSIFEDLIYLTLLLNFLGFLIGYLITTHIYLSQSDEYPIPNLDRRENDTGNGLTAIIYFTHGEPEEYNPMPWLMTFKEFDKDKIKFIPKFARPFFIYNLRKHYKIIGTSNHHKGHLKMMNTLADKFKESGESKYRFYLAFLDDYPKIDTAIIQALNDGASRIIISEIFLTISNHTAEGEEIINSFNLEERFGIQVEFTGPLWNSELLQGSFIEKANNYLENQFNLEINKADVGVILVGHGQPDEWDHLFPTETEHETIFRDKIKLKFVQDGYNSENIYSTWMEFKKPKPKKAMEDLISRNIKIVLYFAAAISADAMHSQYDIPKLINDIDLPNDIKTINLGAWNDHPMVIDAIKEKIDKLLL